MSGGPDLRTRQICADMGSIDPMAHYWCYCHWHFLFGASMIFSRSEDYIRWEDCSPEYRGINISSARMDLGNLEMREE